MTAHRIGPAVSMLLLIVGCGPDRPTDPLAQLTTRAERTRYEQTTGYGEVVRLMEHAATLSERVHFTTFGTTVETRPLPLVVVGDTTDARPESVDPLTVQGARSTSGLRMPHDSVWAGVSRNPAMLFLDLQTQVALISSI